MARLFVLFALCALPALVSAHLPTGRPFRLQGRVYCDTCRAGFETTATTYIAGAKVRVECLDRETLRLKYSLETQTDENGMYEIMVEDDHEDQMCECALVSSPIADCKVADPGRSRASALLTAYMNGVVNRKHIVNNMGFLKDQPLAGCQELLKKYLPTDEDQ
ncbi:Allergen Ole e 1, conserved site [Trema orientale]|uniref:Allergen Ole e 1, conserved site n=1 Tax=Trema orientale TaxID=63057 RepID=A0A2P5FYI1_TREOI|nr:Allergen Ole e 1, conserved site [Trema orientale]